ncbi:MAG: GAF domain-containing protein [Ktedonobacteraceae bacterium]|nr:GAF domain-containing protein [Ktedonobacteraceae bacterium]
MAEKDWEAFRASLKELLRDARVRKLIEQRTDIAPRTLARWASGETEEPDHKRLTSLLHALPQYREPLVAAIRKALPDFDVSLLTTANSLIEDLPVDFWVRLLETNARTPKNLHFMAVVNLIFLQLQSYIDPEHIGVHLIVARCSPPPSPDRPVLSLREVVKMKTHASPFKSPAEHIFLGAESLCGYSVSMCQANVVQNIQEKLWLPVHRVSGERSVAAYPIQRGGAVAGCFLVSSPRPDFFSEQLQYVLQIYTYLLSLAFETDQFYAPERIRLRPMPEAHIQHRSIAEFQAQVLALLQHDASLSQAQAETLVWQQIEATLLAEPIVLPQERRSNHDDAN